MLVTVSLSLYQVALAGPVRETTVSGESLTSEDGAALAVATSTGSVRDTRSATDCTTPLDPPLEPWELAAPCSYNYHLVDTQQDTYPSHLPHAACPTACPACEALGGQLEPVVVDLFVYDRATGEPLIKSVPVACGCTTPRTASTADSGAWERDITCPYTYTFESTMANTYPPYLPVAKCSDCEKCTVLGGRVRPVRRDVFVRENSTGNMIQKTINIACLCVKE